MPGEKLNIFYTLQFLTKLARQLAVLRSTPSPINMDSNAIDLGHVFPSTGH